MLTQEQQINMYGMTEAELEEGVYTEWNDRMGYMMVVMSMLSDAQMELTFDVERARQTINRAKHVLHDKLNDLPDLEGMKKVNRVLENA
tara:strand:+ start:100 stop:366 length:267 start_codon:yes stop_codon:yes gene_type:complete